MKIENIIFDWDGTLAKTLDLWLAGYQSAFAQRSLQYDPRTIVTEFFHDHQSMPQRHPHLDFTPIAEDTREYVVNNVDGVELYEGASRTISSLQDQGLKLSLVTSSSRQLLDKGLGSSEINDVFSSTLAGDDGFGHKPDPLPFAEMLDRMGASAERTLIIGDTHVDIIAGKSVGCKTCLFMPEQNSLFHDFEHLKTLQADAEIDRLEDLLSHI